jgi:putative tricarboxylic transport membrane protein
LAFNWSSFTPIALLALDNFFLWVNSEDSIKNVQDFLKAAKDESMTVGGTGSKQEDELVFSFLQQKAGLKAFKYVPFSGGGAVATALAGKQVRGTVNNPSEGIPFLATPTTPAKLTPIATFTEKPVDDSRFKNLPTVKSLGIDVSYQMLRAIFAPPGISKEAQEYYVGLMEKVFKLEEFRKFLDDNVLDPTFLKGDAFAKFIEDQDALHRDIMVKAGFTKASEPTKLGPNVTIAALAEKKKVTVTNDGPDKVTVVLVDAAGSEVAGEVAAKATGSVTVSGDKTAVKLKIKAGPNGAAVTWKFE